MFPNWPGLAWVARCQPNSPVHVFHGPIVEVSDEWFGEIIWDADYGNADFDRSPHAFGSGGRARSDEFVFVGSCSVVDRLHWSIRDKTTWVSNSIAGLTRLLGLRAHTNLSRYPTIFRSICYGIHHYQKIVPFVGGDVHLTYLANLHWDGQTLIERPKPTTKYVLPNYQSYRDQLSRTIRAISENWADTRRRHPFGSVSSLSTGYDSPAATVLAIEAGLSDAITIRKGRSGDIDDGSTIARYLGVKIHIISRDAWREQPAAECTFIASDAKGEDVYFAGASEVLKQRVLMTGYGGTRVWGLKPQLCEDYQRGDQSGLSHCEPRLHYGYIHLPVPFLVAGQTADLRRISLSSEMQPWHVESSYNCPLARRIVEDAGVPRSAFGMQKKAASVLLFDRESFLTPKAHVEFKAWYAQNIRGFCAFRFACTQRTELTFCGILKVVLWGAAWLARVTDIGAIKRIANSSRLNELARFEPLYRHLFPWALERTQAEYTPAPANPHEDAQSP